MDKELILNGLPFNDDADWKQCKQAVSEFLVRNGVRSQFSIYAVNVSKRSARVAFFSVREGLLSALRKKGRSNITSKRPKARLYMGDLRDSYKQMKAELDTYWQSICSQDSLSHLNVAEDVWMKSIFINQRFSGKGADAKLYFEFLDPTKQAYTLEYSCME